MQKNILGKWTFYIGLIIIGLNVIWIWDNLHFLYNYLYPRILFNFMYPNWILICNSILGIIGIVIGILIVMEKLKTKYGILSSICFITCGEFIRFLLIN